MQFRHRGTHKIQITQNNQEISLTNLNEGERSVIKYVYGGNGVVRRLTEMGLTPGVEVKLLRKGPFRGPIQIEVRGVALALGYGVAAKVFVKPLKEAPNG